MNAMIFGSLLEFKSSEHIQEMRSGVKKVLEEGDDVSFSDTSKYIAPILRHKPEAIGICLDEHGWANVNELIAGIAETHDFNMEMLEEIVDSSQSGTFNSC